MRLPARVRFPFDYTITIKLVTDTEMRAVSDEKPPDPLSDGLWISDHKTIYIRKGLTERRKRYILSHELVHAALDYHHEIADNGVPKQ